jgi:hypothetical protein
MTAEVARKNVRPTVRAPRVLRNDIDVERSRLSAVLGARSRKGTLALKADGSFVFTPKHNVTGADSFAYRARDSGGALSAPVTVRVTISR